MKKKLALLAAAAVAAGILLGGCGGSKGSDTKSSSAAWKPEKDVKIIVAYKSRFRYGYRRASAGQQCQEVCRPDPGHRKQTRG